jgi:hypothetical protein
MFQHKYKTGVLHNDRTNYIKKLKRNGRNIGKRKRFTLLIQMTKARYIL